ncbi:MAG: hypothetical protein Q4D46_07025 [Erysipelotrichaceae bacterium]|nr:hypothetical protein [Erysipelotrichaceae bacterium]
MKVLKSLMLTLFMLCAVYLPVHADMGPKPDLVIDFSGIHEPCVVTVLSTVKSYGPNQPMQTAWMPWWDEQAPEIDKEIYQKFIDETKLLNEDRTEQLYFWGVLAQNSPYVFGYYPPETFYVLVYFPETDSFMLSEESYTRTVFHTELAITVENGKLLFNARQPLYGIMKSWKDNDAVVLRLLVTVITEIVIGMFFMKYTHKSMLTVIGVNVITQILLNIVIWLRYYVLSNSVSTYFPVLAGTEVLIFLIEGFIYSKLISREELSRPYLYALTANAFTCWLGVTAVVLGR